MADTSFERAYLKALKAVAKDAREISSGKIAPHLRTATKSHARQLAQSRLRLQADYDKSLRKKTKFVFCDKHKSRLEGNSRRRLAEIFVEGGPSAGPCSGGTCRLWPGRDLFAADVCDKEMPLPWTKG